MRAPQIVVFLVCVAIFATGQFHRASGGVFTPILMERFAVSAAVIGGLVSAMFFATIAVQVPFGAVLDRLGPRPVLSGCMALVAVGTALFAWNASFDVALLSRIVIGVGLAAMGAATHVIIAQNFPARDFGYISGLVVTWGGIGGLLGTYPLALALAHLPWGLVFGVVAAATAVLAVVMLRVLRAPQENAPKEKKASGGYMALLADAEFRKILTLGIVTYAPITAITGLWGGPYLQDVIGLTPGASGGVLLMLFGATIAAGWIFGVLDRRTRSRRRVIFAAVAVSASCLTFLAIIPSPLPVVAIGLLACMVFAQQFYIPLGAHMRQVVPDATLGRAATLLSVVSVAAIPALQVGFGLVIDIAAKAGLDAGAQYRAGFGLMALLLAICASIYATARKVDPPPN